MSRDYEADAALRRLLFRLEGMRDDMSQRNCLSEATGISMAILEIKRELETVRLVTVEEAMRALLF